MTFQKVIASFAFLALAPLIGCAPAAAPTPVSTYAPTTAPGPISASPVSATPTPATITITDSANRSVTLATTNQRIVSLAPSNTEIACALGLGNRLIAVDTFSDFPADKTKDLPKIKTFPLNHEQVLSFKPDLVLAASITSPDDVKKMTDLNVTVLVVGKTSASLETVFADILLIGKATGTDSKAKSVIDALRAKLDAVKTKVAGAKTKPRVFWELDASDPTKPYTAGPGSFIDELITLAGGVNIATNLKTPYARLSAEEIIAANPDLIILSDAAFGITPDSVKARKGWDVVNAVKNGKVLPIDDNLVSRPGPRIVEGLEAAARLIHPESFQ